MRRYELMLVLRPDAPDERIQAVLDRTTRQIVADEGQIVKVAPWGRRRLAYPIDRYREGSYYIILFEAPPTTIDELERSLMITEERLRHLVVQVERPVKAPRREEAEDSDADAEEGEYETRVTGEGDDESDDGERIDESESEAAPAAID